LRCWTIDSRNRRRQKSRTTWSARLQFCSFRGLQIVGRLLGKCGRKEVRKCGGSIGQEKTHLEGGGRWPWRPPLALAPRSRKARVLAAVASAACRAFPPSAGAVFLQRGNLESAVACRLRNDLRTGDKEAMPKAVAMFALCFDIAIKRPSLSKDFSNRPKQNGLLCQGPWQPDVETPFSMASGNIRSSLLSIRSRNRRPEPPSPPIRTIGFLGARGFKARIWGARSRPHPLDAWGKEENGKGEHVGYIWQWNRGGTMGLHDRTQD